jgi:hypothetical protein
MLTIMLPNHASNGTTRVTWLQCDVDAKSHWRQCCRVMLAMALHLKVVLPVAGLRSPRDWSIDVLLHHKEVDPSDSKLIS